MLFISVSTSYLQGFGQRSNLCLRIMRCVHCPWIFRDHSHAMDSSSAEESSGLLSLSQLWDADIWVFQPLGLSLLDDSVMFRVKMHRAAVTGLRFFEQKAMSWWRQCDVGKNYIYSSMYADWLARRTSSYFDLIDTARILGWLASMTMSTLASLNGFAHLPAIGFKCLSFRLDCFSRWDWLQDDSSPHRRTAGLLIATRSHRMLAQFPASDLGLWYPLPINLVYISFSRIFRILFLGGA